MRKLTAFCILAMLITATSARADETSDSFLAIWKQQADQPNTAAAWQAFAVKNPSNDLAWPARLLQGEDLLRQGNAKAALKTFETVANDPAATSSEPHRLAAKAAQGLVAWAKMSLLAAKLQAYYRQHVEYPASLDDLLAAKLATEADVTDPFGSRFVYAAMERETFPGEPRQKFTLACPAIHAQLDDLESTLDAARAAPKGITLAASDPKDHNAHLAKARPDGSMPPPQRVTVGQELNSDFTLWAICDGYVVIGWRQFPVVVAKE
jgi:hypothetical protein